MPKEFSHGQKYPAVLSVLLLISIIAVMAAGSRIHMKPDDNAVRSLDGEWEFYWNRLLSPEDFADGAPDPAHIPVPGSWLILSGERDDLARYGYATYRTVVRLSPEGPSDDKCVIVHCRMQTPEADGKGHTALFEFEDNGPGINPEDLPHLFDRFFRKSEGFIEGSGLGLAILKGIIDQHGGTVGARNKAEGGAVFSFTLPASTDAWPSRIEFRRQA